MKAKTIFFLTALLFGSFLNATSHPVEKIKKNGKKVFLNTVAEGSIDLYEREVAVLKPTIPEDPMESYTEIQTSYYISKDNFESIQELKSSNYKKILKSMMADKPEIADNIGKKGNRYDDMEKIIQAYNTH